MTEPCFETRGSGDNAKTYDSTSPIVRSFPAGVVLLPVVLRTIALNFTVTTRRTNPIVHLKESRTCEQITKTNTVCRAIRGTPAPDVRPLSDDPNLP